MYNAAYSVGVIFGTENSINHILNAAILDCNWTLHEEDKMGQGSGGGTLEIFLSLPLNHFFHLMPTSSANLPSF